MKYFFFLFLLPASAFGQDALKKAQTDLRLAQEQLRSLSAEINAEEGALIREVEALDDKIVARGKILRSKLKDEEGVAGQQRQLNNELDRRKGEFDYTGSSLRSYGSSIKNRINSAEKQFFGREIAAAEKTANDVGDDLAAEIEGRLAVLSLAADRLLTVTGGSRFSGSAIGAGSTIKDGDFAIAGPLGYFTANDSSVTGFTSFTAEGVDFPTILSADEESRAAISALIMEGSGTVPVDASMGKALQVARTKKGAGDYLQGGGVVGYGILGLGLVALLIAFFKFLEIQIFSIPSRKEINFVLDDLLADRIPEAEAKAKSLKGLGGGLVETGVTFFFDKRRILEDALLEKLGNIQPRLERFLPFLALVAAAAPMMGLLGTVLGIMKTFAMMSAIGTGDSRAFSAGISEALITTAMGLIVAIPVIIVHGLLKSLAKAKFGQAEGVALALLNGTTEIGSSPESEEEPEEMDETDLVTA